MYPTAVPAPAQVTIALAQPRNRNRQPGFSLQEGKGGTGIRSRSAYLGVWPYVSKRLLCETTT
jgi:hypothetical protein